jgi:hypothetical protein
MRPMVVVALLCVAGFSAQPGAIRAADLPAEIATRGIRWIALPQAEDFEVTYRIKDPNKNRDLALTCVVSFLVEEAGRGTLDERLSPARGGLLGMGFGPNYSHTEFRSGGRQGSVYTTMEAEVTGAQGTLTAHCERPRLALVGVGRAVLYLHKRDQPDKPVSNQALLRMAGDDESKKQLQQRYGPALEAAPAPSAEPAAPVPAPASAPSPTSEASPTAVPGEQTRTPQ